ncbi:hypothetical protein D3C72_1553580 [compost metagenome]
MSAGQILVGCGNAALDRHAGGVHRNRITETRQRGAVGAQQEDGFDHVAAGLLDGKGCKRLIIKGRFRHYTVDGERKLRNDLRNGHRGQVAVSAPLVGQKPVGVGDGGLSAFDSNIHLMPPRV